MASSSVNLSVNLSVSVSVIPPVTEISAEITRRSTNPSRSTSSLRTLDEGKRVLLSMPERKLLSTVLFDFYRDLAHSGPTGRTMSELTAEDLADLEDIADHLGMEQGTVDRMVTRAIEEYCRVRAGRRKEKKELGKVASVSK